MNKNLTSRDVKALIATGRNIEDEGPSLGSTAKLPIDNPRKVRRYLKRRKDLNVGLESENGESDKERTWYLLSMSYLQLCELVIEQLLIATYLIKTELRYHLTSVLQGH